MRVSIPIFCTALLGMVMAASCKTPTTTTGPSSASSSKEPAAAGEAPASAHARPSEPSTTPSPGVAASSDAIPAGSGDYSAVLAEVGKYKGGALSFDELQKRLIDRNLPPHKLGCAYLMIPVPAPPPGIPFEPRMMPKDWERTWGEVAMAFWLGKLTRDEYDRLHLAAHPSCPRGK